MSKEMKMADYFDLPLSMLCRYSYGHEMNFEDMSVNEIKAVSHAVNNHDRLVEKNEALREALRLKEAECEALLRVKKKLFAFVNLCAGHQGCSADSMSFFALTNEAAQPWGELGGDDER